MTTATATTNVAAVLLILCLTKTTLALSVAKPQVSNKPAIESLPESSIDVERSMIEFHASEVALGEEAFGMYNHRSDGRKIHETSDSLSSPLYSWGDDDFVGVDIGEENAGVDAICVPKNGHMLFESRSPVLTEEECTFVIEEAKATIAQGLLEQQQQQQQSPSTADSNSNTNSISNSELGEARLSNMPKTRAWLRERLSDFFYPLLNDRFGVDDLVLYDGLVMGHEAPTRSQPIHRDASLLTLNVALSAPTDYEGGGTYIEALGDVLTIDKGHLLCHSGSAMHAGIAISKGHRWVLVLFLLGESRPQLARRCHAKAIEHMRNNEFSAAELVLKTGLESIAPHQDHLLQATLGRLHLAQDGDQAKALESFVQASKAYPICPNALVAVANLMIDNHKPRAALRRLDIVLETIIKNRDLDPSNRSVQMSLRALAYGARRDAARCALICADQLYRNSHEQQQQQQHAVAQQQASWASWTLEHLPRAVERLKICLTAAPNEPNLLGMLDRAEFLCAEAQNELALHHGKAEQSITP